jgi:hypothetical protein
MLRFSKAFFFYKTSGILTFRTWGKIVDLRHQITDSDIAPGEVPSIFKQCFIKMSCFTEVFTWVSDWFATWNVFTQLQYKRPPEMTMSNGSENLKWCWFCTWQLLLNSRWRLGTEHFIKPAFWHWLRGDKLAKFGGGGGANQSYLQR